jgi:hypothetical protein
VTASGGQTTARGHRESSNFGEVQSAGIGKCKAWQLFGSFSAHAGRAVSRENFEWQREYSALLPDLREADVTGSPFAVQSYSVDREFGGDAALARFRKRLRERGVKLLLDFVPNHTALDHPWVEDHPEYYIAGNEGDLARLAGWRCRR